MSSNGHSDALDELLSLMDDPDEVVRKNARKRLEHICYPSPNAFGPILLRGNDIAKYNAERDRLAWAVGFVPSLRRALVEKGPEAKAFAAHRLAGLDVAAFDSIVALLREPEPIAQRAAASALWTFHDAHAVPALIAVLDDEDEQTVESAMFSLGMLKDASAVPAILRWIDDPRWKRRASAYNALSEFDDARCIEAGRRGMRDPKPQVRKAAKRILANADLRCRERKG